MVITNNLQYAAVYTLNIMLFRYRSGIRNETDNCCYKLYAPGLITSRDGRLVAADSAIATIK